MKCVSPFVVVLTGAIPSSSAFSRPGSSIKSIFSSGYYSEATAGKSAFLSLSSDLMALICPVGVRTGFVSYDNRDSAEKAISQMNGYQVIRSSKCYCRLCFNKHVSLDAKGVSRMCRRATRLGTTNCVVHHGVSEYAIEILNWAGLVSV